MPYFAGLDLHKKEIEAVIVDSQGAIILRHRFPTTRAAIQAFAQRHLSRDHQVAVEATFHTWPIVELLEPWVGEVVVSNPMQTRAIAAARIKTDRIDALVLAQLLRTGFLPRVWKPDEETQSLRRRATERANLTADRTRVKNRIHAVLHQRLIEAPPGDLFSAQNLDWLAALPLDHEGQETLGRHLRQLASLEAELKQLNDSLAQHAYEHPSIKLLMTLPGVDFAVAETLLAALGDCARFDSPDKAAAYLGLVPSTHQSGEHCYHGSITKQGRGHARWMLVQAAQHVARHPGPLGVFFRRLAKKKNRNVAVVATARKLVTIAWHMLKSNEPYRYAQPRTTEAKFARLRIRATGSKKRNGSTKGKPRSAAYGTGQSTRAVPALDQIYANEKLPPLTESKPGEQAMLARHQVAEYANAVRTAYRVPRARQQGKRSIIGNAPESPAG